jgi:hypothetical protein
VKHWFSYGKTKAKGRKSEPFRAWLRGLVTAPGKPHRVHLPWLLWQHEEHGEALRVLYRQKYKADADEEDVEADEEDEEDKEDEEDVGDHGEKQAGTARSETLDRRYALGKAFFDGLTEEERTKIQELRENNFKEKMAAYERAAKGEAAFSPDELAE